MLQFSVIFIRKELITETVGVKAFYLKNLKDYYNFS